MKTENRYRDVLGLAGWMVLTFSAALTSVFVSTGGWYANLVKPSWNPPSWVFGPAWTLLYAMMAASAWLVWQRGGWARQRWPLALYLIQWALNALWTPLFFGLQRPGLAFVEITMLAFTLLATVLSFWKARRLAGALMVPYGLWVIFAATLNFAIWRLNRTMP
jgi:tryptophan-rich sensory protein